MLYLYIINAFPQLRDFFFMESSNAGHKVLKHRNQSRGCSIVRQKYHVPLDVLALEDEDPLTLEDNVAARSPWL